MRFQGRHGYYDHEMLTPQPFEVDVELVLDLQPAGVDDDLEKSVDYGKVYAAVRQIVEFDVVPPPRGPGRGDRPRAAGRLQRRRGDRQAAQTRGQARWPARLRRGRDPAPACGRPSRLIRRRPRASVSVSASAPASALRSGPGSAPPWARVSGQAWGPRSARASGPAWATGWVSGWATGWSRSLGDDVVHRGALGDDDPGGRVLASDLSGRHGRIELLGPYPDAQTGVGDGLERA